MSANHREWRPNGIRGRVAFHADDLGMSTAINGGIIEAFERGILTSTSVLANGPAASQGLAAMKQLMARTAHEQLRSVPQRCTFDDTFAAFDLGVHLNLTQGRPLTSERYPSELLDARGCFLGPGRLFAALMRGGKRLAGAIRAELVEQIDFVRDHGVTPTHANGHQYVEMFPQVSQAAIEAISRTSIPVMRLACEKHLAATTLRSRGVSAWGLAHVKRQFARRLESRLDAATLRHTDEFFGAAHAGHITFEVLTRRFRLMRDGALLEVGVHPGKEATHEAPSLEWRDPLAALRPRERDLLCDEALVELMHAQRLGLGRLGAQAVKRSAA
jgi:predicted glycoside hydrolase/deacetylase ChbG (UPF0249 family)